MFHKLFTMIDFFKFAYSLANPVLKLSVSSSIYLGEGMNSNTGARCSYLVSDIAFRNADICSSSPL